MKKIKLSDLQSAINKRGVNRTKSALPPVGIYCQWMDIDGNPISVPLDRVIMKLRGELGQLRTDAQNGRMDLGEYHDQIRAKIEIMLGFALQTTTIMADTEKWQTEIGAAAESARAKGLRNVPAIEDLWVALAPENDPDHLID